MLSKSSLEAAIGLATKYADRNLVILPIGGTPVAALVNASFTPLPVNVEINADPATLLLESANNVNQQGVSEHDLCMDEVVEVVVGTVNRNMDLAQNVVNPMVKATLQAAEERLGAIEQTRGHRYEIVQDIYPAIYANPALSDMVGRYKEQAVQQARLDLIIPAPVDPLALLELAKTGASRFDGEVEAFFAELPEGFAQRVYADFFSDIGPDYNGDLIAHLNPLHTDRRKVLLGHLFARKMMNDVPEGVDRGLEAYRAYMSVIVNQTGRALARLLDKREQDRKGRLLVIPGGLIGSNSKIQVNSDVYLDWLKEGGAPEILYGSAVSDRDTGYRSLIDKAEHYKTLWVKQERTLITRLRLERRNNTLEAINAAMLEQLAKLDPQLKVVAHADYLTRLSVQLQALPSDFDQNLYCSVRGLIARVFFPHTDALCVLEAIDRAAVDNPGIDVREAGFQALIELVGCWVGDLLCIEAVPAGL